MEIKGKRIIITGGAGFIGSNLAAVLAKDNEVVAIDNMHTGSEANLENSAGKGAVRLVKADSADIEKAGIKPDIIFHLGMPSSSPMYKEDNYLVSEVVRGAIGVYRFAMKSGARVVFASTSSVYNGNQTPYTESQQLKVTDFYTEARITVERLAELYHGLYGMDAIGLRLFSVYGPHEESKKGYANLVSQFIWSMKKGESPVVYGDGSQTRDFTYVDDIVDAFIKAAGTNGFDIFNAGTGKSFSLNELVSKLGTAMGVDTKPKYISADMSNYVMRTMADTGKAEKTLGFKAKNSLDDGIRKLVEYYG
jgi:UDP-glucose 4-epimerase